MGGGVAGGEGVGGGGGGVCVGMGGLDPGSAVQRKHAKTGACLAVLTTFPCAWGGTRLSHRFKVSSGRARRTLKPRRPRSAVARPVHGIGAGGVGAGRRAEAGGVFGRTDAEGELVHAGPHDMQLQVRISAHGVSPERLRALVQDSHCCSPVSDALQTAVPVALRIDVDTA